MNNVLQHECNYTFFIGEHFSFQLGSRGISSENMVHKKVTKYMYNAYSDCADFLCPQFTGIWAG